MPQTLRADRDARPKPFQPAIGTDFGPVRDLEAESRHLLTRLVATVAAGGVAVAGLYGLWREDYTPIVSVWSVAGPIVGALVTYYFGKRNETG